MGTRSLRAAAVLIALAGTARAQAGSPPALAWTDIRDLGVEGQGWSDTKAPYDRLPAKAERMVREPVWDLSRHSSGMCVRFVTDATAIHARWTLIRERLGMPHMPPTSVSGLDLYVRTEGGRWRWLAVGRPTEFPTNTVELVKEIPASAREYMLYLPLYNGVRKVEIGVTGAATVRRAPPRPGDRRKPLLFYGTSITHGASASRPGMVHTAILGRRFDMPVINLGFSGNGKMEPELAALVAELDAAVYVLDCVPNMFAEEIATRVEPFVRTLRAAHPATPILLAEDRTYPNGFLVLSQGDQNAARRAALKAAYGRLVAAGVTGLSYLDGEKLLGDDGDATVDGSHPTDLGFMRQADALEGALHPLVGKLSGRSVR
jgi:lysophospholipase L1-like esterase